MRRHLVPRNIATHPFVVAELALGSLRDRARALALPSARVAQIGEVRAMIERRLLCSQGIGFTGAHLVASCRLDRSTQLWTKDKRLRDIAESLAIAADLP
jgi:hypothetical protein